MEGSGRVQEDLVTPPHGPLTMHRVHTIREHETFREGECLKAEDLRDLEAFARGQDGSTPVLGFNQRGELRADNYVGVLTTKRGAVVEVLPKIHLGGERPNAETRQVFLEMLRTFRGLEAARNLPPSSIRALCRFPMLEVFIRIFLDNVSLLVRGGLGRKYVRLEDNLRFLRGRLLFRQHLRENLFDRSRFFVEHDELSPNRPANRLIHRTLVELQSVTHSEPNRQFLRDLQSAFTDVPVTQDSYGDWRKHSVDRSMAHYRSVMPWVELFLFDQGLATWTGKHENRSLLFPMQDVYEDFVTDAFRRHQDRFDVVSQGPLKPMASSVSDSNLFNTRPDVSLMEEGEVRFVLDAKWKHVASGEDALQGIAPADIYQLYAYARRYDCKTVALVYPQHSDFKQEQTCTFFDGIKLAWLPFDVASPGRSVNAALGVLE